ncbi:MAG: site-2 protease family protein [Chloroflexi bacterium]|nr:site-2 protease family protein [Chloroflexota bacterium]|tara:strand:+ start:29870 stop:30562 length:693 start_codon:yes stop_codon:yes gene_type:complete
MIIQLFDELINNPINTIIYILIFCSILLITITFHEFSHSYIANKLGDKTSKNLGRLTLNPSKHLDPMGTMMLFFAGFGWGKPVPVNPINLSPNPKTGLGLVSLAGPGSNIFIAFISTIPIRLGFVDISSIDLNYINSSFSIGHIIGLTIFLNLLLATFNLLPIAPLDGFKIAIGILPRKLAYDFSKLEKYGPLILLSLVFIPFVIPKFSILPIIIYPIMKILLIFIMIGS